MLYLTVTVGAPSPSSLALKNATEARLFAWPALPNAESSKKKLQHNFKKNFS